MDAYVPEQPDLRPAHRPGGESGEVIDERRGILPRLRGEAPGPAMDREEADRALARLGAEHEAIETSLLALQDHAGRRLLEGPN